MPAGPAPDADRNHIAKERGFMSHQPARVACRVSVAIILVALLAATVAAQTGATADASLAPAGPLTLRDCVRLALDSSASLRIREAEVQIAEDDVQASWGAFLPNLSVNGSYNKSDRTDFDSEQPIYGPAYQGFETVGGDSVYIPYNAVVGATTQDVNVKATSKNWGLSANLTVFDGLANVNRLKASQKSRDAAYLSADYTREQVIQNVAVAYYNLLRFTRLEEVARDTRDQAAAELERTETYFRLGSAAKSEVLQQRVRLEQTKYDLVVAQNRVEQAVADLAYAMNRPLAERVAIDTSPLRSELTIEDIDALYEEALANRLDLRGTQLNAEAADYNAAAATGAFIPRLDVYARYSRSYDESPYKFGSQESQSWLWGGQVTWDVFNRFQNFTNRSQARARARIAEYQHEQAALDAQLEVRQYHNAMREAIEKHNVSTETISQAEEELRLAQERFRVGAGTQLDRITAEVNVASARAEQVQAVCDYLIARVSLWRAVGRYSQLLAE
jgi:outer membrane protein